eukprot:gene1114-1668_t
MREEIENLLKIKIRKLGLYQEALIHKSAIKQYNATQSNERLEFIGDSVLNLIVAKYLYDKFPEKDEGFLTKTRTKLVNGKNLSFFAKQMNLQNHIRMNTKAMTQKWNENSRILEDTFEALIGSIYLDMGLLQSKTFIIDKIEKHIDLKYLMQDDNHKDQLMKLCHNRGYQLPVYQLVNETGENASKLFEIHVIIEGDVFGKGIDKNKKEAEQKAAQETLLQI